MKTSETESKEMKRKHQQSTHTNLNDVLREKVPAPMLERSQEKTKVAIEVIGIKASLERISSLYKTFKV